MVKKKLFHTAYSVGDEVTYNNVQYRVIEDSSTSDANVTLLKAEPLTAEEITTYSSGTGAQTDGNGGMRYQSNGNEYSTSYVKTTVDAWAAVKVPNGLQEAGLITIDDLIDNLDYEEYEAGTTIGYRKTELTPSWVYNSNYQYWTMTSYFDSLANIWCVGTDGSLGGYGYYYDYYRVRPVIIISKSVL